jgi:hypothetical protein
MTPWTDGLRPTRIGHSGSGKIRPYGKGFLLDHTDGVFDAPAFRQPWRILTTEFQLTDALDSELCRDLVSYDPASQRWLLASNSGIHLIEGSRVVRTVFTDSATHHENGDDHDLILQIVPFREYFFVSFARLKNNAIGVRLEHDLAHWKTIRNTPK